MVARSVVLSRSGILSPKSCGVVSIKREVFFKKKKRTKKTRASERGGRFFCFRLQAVLHLSQFSFSSAAFPPPLATSPPWLPSPRYEPHAPDLRGLLRWTKRARKGCRNPQGGACFVVCRDRAKKNQEKSFFLFVCFLFFFRAGIGPRAGTCTHSCSPAYRLASRCCR